MGMRDNDGRKLDHKTLEQVRIRVVQQVEHGARPEYLASVRGFPVPLYSGGWHDTGKVAWMSSKLGPYPVGHRNCLDLSYARSTLLL